MNCEKCKELLVEHIEGLLDKPQSQAVAEHLMNCPACQAEAKQLSNLQNRLVKNASKLAQSSLEDNVINKIVRQQNEMLKATRKAGSGPKIRRIIMKSPIVKLAAAAVIIIGAFAAINFYSDSGTSVALAGVLERIEQVQAFMYRMEMTMTGNMMPNMPTGEQQIQITVIISDEFGMKMETQMTNPATGQNMTQQMYIIPDQKVMLMLMPEQKKYMRMEFDDDLLVRMKKQNNDPRETIKQIMSCEYTELGRSIIDGIEVDGFETNDPSFMAGLAENQSIKLWVDVETWLPVRTEMDIKMNEQMQMHGVIYDYQWDILIDASEFQPAIPEDYTALPNDGMKMPSMNEESAIEGLKLFAELTGRYPENLNIITLIQEATEKLTKESEQLQTEDEIAAKAKQVTTMIQSLGGFYIMLSQEKKDPAYYGDSVSPDDVDAVLLRWKVSEDNYKVIFGDLSTADVSAEELAELEKPSSQ